MANEVIVQSLQNKIFSSALLRFQTLTVLSWDPEITRLLSGVTATVSTQCVQMSPCVRIPDFHSLIFGTRDYLFPTRCYGYRFHVICVTIQAAHKLATRQFLDSNGDLPPEYDPVTMLVQLVEIVKVGSRLLPELVVDNPTNYGV